MQNRYAPWACKSPSALTILASAGVFLLTLGFAGHSVLAGSKDESDTLAGRAAVTRAAASSFAALGQSVSDLVDAADPAKLDAQFKANRQGFGALLIDLRDHSQTVAEADSLRPVTDAYSKWLSAALEARFQARTGDRNAAFRTRAAALTEQNAVSAALTGLTQCFEAEIIDQQRRQWFDDLLTALALCGVGLLAAATVTAVRPFPVQLGSTPNWVARSP